MTSVNQLIEASTESFDINEQGLGDTLRVYEADIKPFKLTVTRWHRESVVYESDNLMDVLAYIQKHHYRDDSY